MGGEGANKKRFLQEAVTHRPGHHMPLGTKEEVEDASDWSSLLR